MQHNLFERARRSFNSGKTLPLDFRISQLQGLLKFYNECQNEIENALKADLRRTKFESAIYETELLKADLNNILRNFAGFTKSERLPWNWLTCLDVGVIRKEAFGVTFILGTWNSPFVTTLLPLHGAIAAGNCVVIKPSELATHSSKVLARFLPKYLDKNCYPVFEGGVDETKELLKNKFDYIFATGASSVGKSIYKHAAQKLIPVTLQLGGKCPVYIDEKSSPSDIQRAVKRILWGKCINMGQTSIAPDYILCSKKTEEEFIQIAQKELENWFGVDAQKSPDISRLANQKQFLRLKSILDRTKGTIVVGGEIDQKDLWVAPTLISGVDPETDSTMEDEIFGPILPFITCNSPEEAIKFINSRPKPIALYIFSNDTRITNDFLNLTRSGGVCVNDVMWQSWWEGLPCGGIGESGMGIFHGRFSVDTFSHIRGVLIRSFTYFSEKIGESRYPPYSEKKIFIFSRFLRYYHYFNLPRFSFTYALAGLFGAGLYLIKFTMF